MDKIASVVGNGTVRTVFNNGCATGLGRLISENAWIPFTIIIVLVIIWYFAPHVLHPVPILGPYLRGDDEESPPDAPSAPPATPEVKK